MLGIGSLKAEKQEPQELTTTVRTYLPEYIQTPYPWRRGIKIPTARQ